MYYSIMSVSSDQIKLSSIQESSLRSWLWGLVLAFATSSTLFLIFFFVSYQNRAYQGITINQVPVGGLTRQEIISELNQQTVFSIKEGTLILATASPNQESREVQIAYSQLFAQPDYEETASQALEVGRTGSFWQRSQIIISLLFKELNLETKPQLNSSSLNQALSDLAQQSLVTGNEPSVLLSISKDPQSLQLNPGQDGWQLNVDASQNMLESWLTSHYLNHLQPNYWPDSISLAIAGEVMAQTLSDQEREQVKIQTLNLVGKQLELEPQLSIESKEATSALSNINLTISDQELISFLKVQKKSALLEINHQLVGEKVKAIANIIDKPAQNAIFVYDLSSLRASAFQPHQTGFGVDQEQLKQAIVSQLEQLIQPDTLLSQTEADSQYQKTDRFQVQLIIKQTQPEIALQDTNNLGINELIGFGESYYTGSIPARSHNVTTASSKLNFALIPPNEEFSFNKTVGPVTSATGFKDAYVIRSGRTLLESGGGVCQVSTTLFRAMLDAGVNITLRLPHSYRVRYYELENKPGFDATVYAGNVDLRFVNDTPGYLLIVAETDPNNAYATARIYGTSDGRRAEIGGYKQWGYTAAPPPQDIPDPNLAPGQRKQVENAIPGLKTSFDWTVFDQSGNVLHQKTFFSHYHAWGAKFLVGM